jgi:hypothetical protein
MLIFILSLLSRSSSLFQPFLSSPLLPSSSPFLSPFNPYSSHSFLSSLSSFCLFYLQVPTTPLNYTVMIQNRIYCPALQPNNSSLFLSGVFFLMSVCLAASSENCMFICSSHRLYICLFPLNMYVSPSICQYVILCSYVCLFVQLTSIFICPRDSSFVSPPFTPYMCVCLFPLLCTCTYIHMSVFL